MLRQQERAGETTAPAPRPPPITHCNQQTGRGAPQPAAPAAKVTPGPEECVPPVPTRRALIRGMSADSCACPSGLTSPASYESAALAKGSFSKGFQGRGARDAHAALNPLLAERERSPSACTTAPHCSAALFSHLPCSAAGAPELGTKIRGRRVVSELAEPHCLSWRHGITQGMRIPRVFAAPTPEVTSAGGLLRGQASPMPNKRVPGCCGDPGMGGWHPDSGASSLTSSQQLKPPLRSVLQMQLGDSGTAADGSHLQQGDGMAVTKSLHMCPTPPDLPAQGFLRSHQSVRGHDRVLQSGPLVKPKLSTAAPASLAWRKIIAVALSPCNGCLEQLCGSPSFLDFSSSSSASGVGQVQHRHCSASAAQAGDMRRNTDVPSCAIYSPDLLKREGCTKHSQVCMCSPPHAAAQMHTGAILRHAHRERGG